MDGVEAEGGEGAGGEAEKKKRFREFWMGKLVRGFGEDLDVVRQVSASFLCPDVCRQGGCEHECMCGRKTDLLLP